MKAFHRLHALRLANDQKRQDMDTMAPRFDRLRDRHTNGTAPRAVSAFQLFQTPEDIAARMVELAEPRPGLDWLEPSAGLGRIITPILATDPASVTACEENAEIAGELFRTFPGVVLGQGNFLDRKPSWEGGGALIVKPFPNGPVQFDRIAMNPPFHMRADVRHILHALQFLKPGGVLVGLCLATHHREIALRHLADHWETTPAGTFRKEGTNVETYLFRIRKPS
jgi:SAM-dependent methyltransferase